MQIATHLIVLFASPVTVIDSPPLVVSAEILQSQATESLPKIVFTGDQTNAVVEALPFLSITPSNLNPADSLSASVRLALTKIEKV